MIKDEIALRAMPETGADAKFLRDRISFADRRPMELETEGLCAVGHG